MIKNPCSIRVSSVAQFSVAQFSAVAFLFVSGVAAHAENIDLSTVPRRNTVQLTIYNSEDLTLVRETRKVTFKPGVNPLQFSWANTLIDPTSVELRFLTHPDKLTVLDSTFPHDKPQMLYWNVQSELDGEAMVEITYFTSGIHWSADYVGIAGADEKQLDLESFVRVDNQSGEDYENARVRLVVGRVNLVEKITQLARERGLLSESLEAGKKKELALHALRDMSRAKRPMSKDGKGMAFGGRRSGEEDAEELEVAPKEIVKEGLSEYFIYTIEGTETIPNGWAKRLRSFDAASVPVKIQYRYRPAEYGEQLVRMYLMTNDKDSKLGTTPLPDGTFRLFRSNGPDGLSYLVSQPIKYVPIGDKIELNLGVDPEVIFDLVKLKTWRDAIWMRVRGANVFQRVDQPGVQFRVNSTVAGSDEHALFAQRVRNYTKKPIDLEIRRTLPGDVVFRSSLPAKNHDFQTVQYTATVPAGAKADLQYEVIRHQGRNAKQNHVTVEAVKSPLPEGEGDDAGQTSRCRLQIERKCVGQRRRTACIGRTAKRSKELAVEDSLIEVDRHPRKAEVPVVVGDQYARSPAGSVSPGGKMTFGGRRGGSSRVSLAVTG